MNLFYHFILYGCIGWIVEIVFTGFYELIFNKDVHATGKTYLLMHPIYALAGLGFEGFRYALVLGSTPLIVRVFAYLVVIYLVEYISGLLLRKMLGRCPWDYGNTKWAVNGLIRLDYAPFWFGLCWIIEPTQAGLSKMFCE